MTTKMKVTEYLVNFVVETDFDDIPKEVVEHAKFCVLDWIGAALAGAYELPTNLLVSIIKAMGGREESTIIGWNFKTSCLNAALVNGLMGHVVELDDLHEGAVIHPSAPVLPAALAAAERKNTTGEDLITSVVLGYEVEIRVGMSIMPSHYKFWHTTGTCGTFGAAVAAGKILGLDKEKMLNALGIAGTQAAGLIEVFGTMSKPLNVGKSAMNGVISALLAEKGFTSSSSILEAEKGYCRATAEKFEYSKLTENLGKNFELLNNIFKRHASCGHTHGAIDAVLHITEKYDIKPHDVEEIVVETYPIAAEIVGKNYAPKTAAEAKFSIPYCVAVALIRGRVSLSEFSKEKLKDPNILELSRKVKVMVDPEYINAKLGYAKVILRTKGGEEYTYRVDVPKGYPKNPLTKWELKAKFRTLASTVFPEKKVTEIIRQISNLEKVRIRDLMTLLRPSVPY